MVRWAGMLLLLSVAANSSASGQLFTPEAEAVLLPLLVFDMSVRCSETYPQLRGAFSTSFSTWKVRHKKDIEIANQAIAKTGKFNDVESAARDMGKEAIRQPYEHECKNILEGLRQ